MTYSIDYWPQLYQMMNMLIPHPPSMHHPIVV